MNGSQAAEIAREAARGQGTYFTALSGQMCWDAVAACQGRNPGRGVAETDPVVSAAEDIYTVPEGASVGFFDNGTLVHEMISVGNGEACGNKNECIGIGHAIGWEMLDLAGATWNNGRFGPRNLIVRYRAM